MSLARDAAAPSLLVASLLVAATAVGLGRVREGDEPCTDDRARARRQSTERRRALEREVTVADASTTPTSIARIASEWPAEWPQGIASVIANGQPPFSAQGRTWLAPRELNTGGMEAD